MSALNRRSWRATLALLGAFIVGGAAAQDGNVADVWVMHVKQGQSEAFEAAFNKHVAFRKKEGDPRAWRVYTSIVGDDVGHYVVRWCCGPWTALDEYAQWSGSQKAQENWNRTVDKHVERYDHYMHVVDFEASNWPEELKPNMVGVTYFDIKSGHAPAVTQAKARISALAKEGGWPRNWAWLTTVGGSGPLTLVVPYGSFADMAPPEQSFVAFLTETMGSEEDAMALWNQFTGGVRDSRFTVYRYRGDMSMDN